MNELTHLASKQRSTQAAEGLPRWRWTTAELVRLTELGAFTAEDRFELIGGEMVPMPPVGRRHEVVASEIEDCFRSRAAASIRVRTERQLNLTDDTYAKPDIFIHDAGVRPPDVRGDTALLVLEIAASGLTVDLTTKAKLYAQHGGREYWVVDAATLMTTVHRDPGPDGFGQLREVAATDPLVPLLVPELAVRMADLKLD